MKLVYSDHFKKRLAKRLAKNPLLKAKVRKQLRLLEKTPNHPSLKLHKLKGARAEEYSFWLTGNLRVTFLMAEGKALLSDIITHDEY